MAGKHPAGFWPVCLGIWVHLWNKMTATMNHRWSFSPPGNPHSCVCHQHHHHFHTHTHDPPGMNVWKQQVTHTHVQKSCCWLFSLTVNSLHLNISPSFSVCLFCFSIWIKKNDKYKRGNNAHLSRDFRVTQLCEAEWNKSVKQVPPNVLFNMWVEVCVRLYALLPAVH